MKDSGLNIPLQDSKIDSIQVLRGVAALIVTVYHVKDLLNDGDPFKKELDFLFNSGAAGVNLFFVISGFIMVFITRSAEATPAYIYRFLVKRFARVWPTYALITLGYYFLQHRVYVDAQLLKELVLSLTFIPVTTTSPPFFGYATLPVGWTLNYEIYFYLLIALSMLFGKFRWLVFFAITIGTLVLMPMLLGHFTFDTDRTHDFNSRILNLISNPVIWNFSYGIVVGLLYESRFAGFLLFIFSRTWITALVIALAVWQYLSGFFGGLGPLQWGVGAAAAFTAFLFYSAQHNIRYPAWLERLGDISFSVYLLHLPVMVVLTQIFIRWGYPVYTSGTAMFLLTVTLTIILSNVSYQYLELKMSTAVRNVFPGMRRK